VAMRVISPLAETRTLRRQRLTPRRNSRRWRGSMNATLRSACTLVTNQVVRGLEDDRVIELASHSAGRSSTFDRPREGRRSAREWDSSSANLRHANVSVVVPTSDGRVLKVAWRAMTNRWVSRTR